MSARGRGWAALAAVAVTLAGPAAAGPGRRDRPDADAAAERKSELWGELTHPGSAAARSKLDDALRLMRLRTGDLATAIELLTDVTAVLPDQADGFGYLAIAAENLRRWPACAAAYASARAIDPAWRPQRLLETRPMRLQGVARALPLSIAYCQGRAGDLVGAAATLSAAVARGESSAELWLRTGEIAMAQGRLDDAIAALERAGGEGPARWLLAMALDRARRDDDTDAAAENARRYDPRAGAAGWSTVPLVVGDNDYLLGLAELHGDPATVRLELAIAYFRRFLRSAPADSPWRARAQAHLDALAALDLDARIAIDGDGVTAAQRAAIVAKVATLRPALAACMAPVPTRVEELALTVASVIPLKPMPWPRVRRPARVLTPLPTPPRVAVTSLPMPLRADEDRDAVDRAEGCLTAVGARLVLPSTGGLYQVRIPVVAR